MLPYVIIHNSVSTDSRLDWLTPDVELSHRFASKWNEGATVVCSETILNPNKLIPDEDDSVFQPIKMEADDKRPILVVPDSGGRIRTWHYLKKLSNWKNFIALCSDSTPENYFDYLKERHIEWIFAGFEQVDFKEAFEELNSRYNINSIRVEGGGTLNGILLRNSLVNEISLLIHPQLVGGMSSQTFFYAKDLDSIEGVTNLKLIHFEKLDNDIIWLIYEVKKI